MIQPLAQLFAWVERYHLPFGDGQGFAGLRVTSSSWGLVSDIHTAELDQFDRFPTDQGILQGRKNGIDDFRCIPL